VTKPVACIATLVPLTAILTAVIAQSAVVAYVVSWLRCLGGLGLPLGDSVVLRPMDLMHLGESLLDLDIGHFDYWLDQLNTRQLIDMIDGLLREVRFLLNDRDVDNLIHEKLLRGGS
jgi:hypothetical protein